MADEKVRDDLDLYQAELTEEEREEISAASVALDLARLAYVAREQRGLTQKEAAERAGVQQQMVSRLEGGAAQPTFKTLERYLRRLGFALDISLTDAEQQDVVDSVLLNEANHPQDPSELTQTAMLTQQR